MADEGFWLRSKEESKVPLLMDWKGKVTEIFGVPDKDGSLVLIDKNWTIVAYQMGDLTPEFSMKIEE
jgi:hypothetical protein